MNLEDYKKIAMNPIRRDAESFFILEKVLIDPLWDKRGEHYPNYTVGNEFKFYCKSLDEAEKLMMEDIEYNQTMGNKGFDNRIFCFYIKEFPLGEVVYRDLDCCISWRSYDLNGKLIDCSVCGGNGNISGLFSIYRGRSESQIRFRPGDIVEYKWEDQIILGRVVNVPYSIEETFNIHHRIITYFRQGGNGSLQANLTDEEIMDIRGLDINDDCYTLSTPWNSSTGHISANCINVFAPHFPIPENQRNKLFPNANKE